MTLDIVAALQANPRKPWDVVWESLVSADAQALPTISPLCDRYSDIERCVPSSTRRALIRGEAAPPALSLCRLLDWSHFVYEAVPADDSVQDCFSRAIVQPSFRHITHLVLGDEANYLTTKTLNGFSSLKSLVIRTREAFTSAIRDTHCVTIGQSTALHTLQSLVLDHCDISGKGLSSILESPHLGPLSSLELYVPARSGLLSNLARATKVLSGITTLGLAADGWTEAGARRLVEARDALSRVRTLRIVAAETGGFDWEVSFDRHDGQKNVRNLAKALLVLLPALDALEKVEIVHRRGSSPRIVGRDVITNLATTKDVRALVLPASMI